MSSNKELFNRWISWKKHKSNPRYYYHMENERIILLRINNFPDEPVYTLINGLEIEDIDDKPLAWELEM